MEHIYNYIDIFELELVKYFTNLALYNISLTKYYNIVSIAYYQLQIEFVFSKRYIYIYIITNFI